MNFVAIDFETANATLDSACALGAVVVKNGKITERRYSLIDPGVKFEKFCTYIHNITAERVVGMPLFSDVYARLFPLIDGAVVVAHNVAFDYAVLKASCESRALTLPRCSPFCTVEMAQKAWPDLPRHKLNSLCSHFSIALTHHNAVDDATACAQLLLLCAKEQKVKTIAALRAKLSLTAPCDDNNLSEQNTKAKNNKTNGGLDQ